MSQDGVIRCHGLEKKGGRVEQIGRAGFTGKVKAGTATNCHHASHKEVEVEVEGITASALASNTGCT